MTAEEQRIVSGIMAGDNKVIEYFFYKKCRPMFHGIIHDVFRNNADYDELINDFYIYLVENRKDAQGNNIGCRLSTFGGKSEESVNKTADDTSSLISWIKNTAHRFFVPAAKRSQDTEKQRQNIYSEDGETQIRDFEDERAVNPMSVMDFGIYLNMLKKERDRKVIEQYFLKGMEVKEIAEDLGLKSEVVSNIKKRALDRLRSAARHALGDGSLCSIACQQYVLDTFGIHKQIDELEIIAKDRELLAEDGSTLQDIGKLCSFFGLQVHSGDGCTMENLEENLEKGYQVIAAVDGGELTGDQFLEHIEDKVAGGVSDHCVVVLAVNGDKIDLFDPSCGFYTIEVTRKHFLDAWEDSNCYMAVVQRD